MTTTLNTAIENTMLQLVQYGRWLKQDWQDAQITPEIANHQSIDALLCSLTEPSIRDISSDGAFAEMGAEIRHQLNKEKPGYGDLAMRIDTSEHLVFDERREQLRKLAEAWKSFRGIMTFAADLHLARHLSNK